MKKITTTIVAILLVMSMGATVAAAAPASISRGQFEIDGSFGFASGPGDFSGGVGFNFGAGYMMDDLLENLQARIDIGYFSFDRAFFGTTLDFTRLPVTVSARYYIPVSSAVNVYAQAGFETTFDNFDFVQFAGFKQSKSETNFGVTPGIGAEIMVMPNFSVFAQGRWHVISDHYFSSEFGAAIHF